MNDLITNLYGTQGNGNVTASTNPAANQTSSAPSSGLPPVPQSVLSANYAPPSTGTITTPSSSQPITSAGPSSQPITSAGPSSNLPPKMNDAQIRNQIDSFTKQGAPTDVIQSFLDSYQKSSDGSYILKTASPTAQPTDALGKVVQFGRNVAGDIIQPFESVAKTVGSLGSAAVSSGVNALGGDIGGGSKNFESEYQRAQGINNALPSPTAAISGGGVTAPARDLSTTKGFEQTAGDVGMGALNLTGIGDIADLGANGAKAAVGEVAKTSLGDAALTGAKFGAGYGAAGAAQEDGDFKDMALKTAEGGVLGAGLGVAGGLAGKGISKLVNDVSSKVVANTEASLGTKLSPEQVNQLNSFTESHIKTQLADSAQRLNDAGINPQELYNKYINVEKGAANSIHNDVALTNLGKEVGDAYNQLAKQRQTVGAQQGAIMEKLANEPVNVVDRITNFNNEIDKNLNSFTESEKKVLTTLQKETPPDTVKGLTDYVTKMRNTYEELKGQNGVTGTTNAERILSNYVNGISEDINTQHPELGSTRDEYARLSGLLQDGEKIVGKQTSNGEYRAVTSSAKSAVNSILDGGKKQFLIDLGNETGNPLLDKALVASQAMSDMGNKKGDSLLQSILGTGIPSPKSITSRALDAGVDFAKEKIVGTKPEITSKYIGKVIKK